MILLDIRNRFVKYRTLEKVTMTRSRLALATLALLASAVPSGAHAGIVTAGGSDAYGINASITVNAPLLPPVVVSVPTQPTVTGTAPSPYSLSNSTVNLNAGVTGVATVGASLLDVTASSTINGLWGSATASSAVTGLGVSVGPASALLGSHRAPMLSPKPRRPAAPTARSRPLGRSSSPGTRMSLSACSATPSRR
jgi:hypothetical protein